MVRNNSNTPFQSTVGTRLCLSACVWCATGIEVGEYAGFVSGLRQLQQQAPGSLPPRLDRNLAAMEECLSQFPLYDPLVRDMVQAAVMPSSHDCYGAEIVVWGYVLHVCVGQGASLCGCSIYTYTSASSCHHCSASSQQFSITCRH